MPSFFNGPAAGFASLFALKRLSGVPSFFNGPAAGFVVVVLASAVVAVFVFVIFATLAGLVFAGAA